MQAQRAVSAQPQPLLKHLPPPTRPRQQTRSTTNKVAHRAPSLPLMLLLPPSTKRARTTKAGSAAASSSSAAAVKRSSPMLDILARDSGAQFALCEMLPLKGIGRLNRSCRSWRRWIDEGSFGSNRLLRLKKRVPVGLRRSAWAPRYVQRLVLGSLLRTSDGDDEDDCSEDDAKSAVDRNGNNEEEEDQTLSTCEAGRLDEIALRLLPHLHRLRALKVVLTHSTDDGDEEDSGDGDDSNSSHCDFSGDEDNDNEEGKEKGQGDAKAESLPALLSSTLTTLVIDVRACDDPLAHAQSIDPFTLVILRSLGGLPSLTSLTITSERLWSSFRTLDFSALPSLTQLQCMCIQTRDPVRCTRKQVAALVACRSLTELEVGVWAPSDCPFMKPAIWVQDRSAQALAALVRGRKLNGATPLRKFALCDASLRHQVLVTPAVAEHLLSLTSLESLEHVHWGYNLTAAHWSQLSQFTQLHTFHFATESDLFTRVDKRRAAHDLGFDRAVAALQHCAALRTLFVEGRLAFRLAHAALLATFPSLSSITLKDVLVESLDPLTRAPKLTQLKLDRCFGIEDTRSEPVCLRSLIPALPRLTALTLKGDSDETESDPYASAALTAALFARLPLLTPAGFSHKTTSRSWERPIGGWFPRSVNF